MAHAASNNPQIDCASLVYLALNSGWGDVARMLIARSRDFVCEETSTTHSLLDRVLKLTQLEPAISTSSPEEQECAEWLVQTLLARVGGPSGLDSNRGTPLSIALSDPAGRVQKVHILLDHGVDPMLPIRDGGLPLVYCGAARLLCGHRILGWLWCEYPREN